MFSTLKSWFLTEEFRGDSFVNSTCETTDAQHPVRLIAQGYKQKVVDLIFTPASQLAMPLAKLFSRQILLLIDGAITVAVVMNLPGTADHARATAKIILENHTKR